MTKGTKSLLFGVHQFLWHPFTVLLAWLWLYRKMPNPIELFCIFVHDWGYWGKVNMDDEEGEKHPVLGADIAGYFFGEPAYMLVLMHSRHYAKKYNATPSKLCWADKLSIMFEPWWLYLPRAWASGELYEYRMIAANAGMVPATATHRYWYTWLQERLKKIGNEQRGDAVAYVNNAANY